MKKILCLLLVVILLFLSVGCNSQEKPSESVSETESASEAEQKETVPPTYKSNGKNYDNTPEQISGGIHDAGAPYFEEYIDKITHIVKAEFLGTVKIPSVEGKMYLFDFNVKEVCRGELSDQRISIIVHPHFYSAMDSIVSLYTTNAIMYEPGNDYLLLLSREMSALSSEDLLKPVDRGSLVIPLDENGKPNIEESQMYQKDLLFCIKDETLKADINEGRFLESLLERTKDNPNIRNYTDTLINETNTEVILDAADLILNVEIIGRVAWHGYTAEYKCKLIEVKKGDTPLLDEDGTMILWLPAKNIVNGKKYSVALNKMKCLISRNGIIPIE